MPALFSFSIEPVIRESVGSSPSSNIDCEPVFNSFIDTLILDFNRSYFKKQNDAKYHELIVNKRQAIYFEESYFEELTFCALINILLQMEKSKPPFAYTAEELSSNFLGTQTDREITRKNLKEILKRMFPEKTEEFTENDRSEFLCDIREGRLAFGYLALMISDNHPLVRKWNEREKRASLYYTLGKIILSYECAIANREFDIWSIGDERTRKDIEKQMKPYKEFQEKLLDKISSPQRIH